jgi:hypothetical protein
MLAFSQDHLNSFYFQAHFSGADFMCIDTHKKKSVMLIIQDLNFKEANMTSS